MSGPRPSRSGPEAIARHEELIRPQIKEHLGCSDADLDNAMAEVMRALRHNHDGYQIAKELERDGWDADEELVELMGGIVSMRSDAHDDVVRTWVAANNIRPPHTVGDAVQFADSKKQLINGFVAEVREKDAMYLVRCPSLGHVEKGSERGGTLGFHVKYEDVRDLP